MALNVGLEMLAGGELKEKYDDAMKKVLANLWIRIHLIKIRERSILS